jgi:hypothetical protein
LVTLVTDAASLLALPIAGIGPVLDPPLLTYGQILRSRWTRIPALPTFQ